MKNGLSLFFVLLPCLLFSQSKQAYLNAAGKAFAQEDYSQSLQLYLNALEYDEDELIMFHIGECNRRLFQYATAVAWFNKSLAAGNTECITYYRLAETLSAMEKSKEAKDAVAQGLQNKNCNAAWFQKLLASIDKADSIRAVKENFLIEDAGKNVNSPYSDFAAFPANDSMIYFSSLRFESGTDIVSRILVADADSVQVNRPKELKQSINNPSWHNCNASVSPDGKIMVFSRCNYDENKKLICNLYESTLVNGSWQQPLKLSSAVNAPECTSTQPCITTAGIAGYALYYASDRRGGNGGTDLYRSFRNAHGDYTQPENCGKRINTRGNEMTPFYNTITNTLYFSSDSMYGLGGFDIYKININDSLSTAVNAGIPFNSGYNDLYYTQYLTDEEKGFLSSNRPGSKTLNGSACCYDIYRFRKKAEEVVAVETHPEIPIKELQPDHAAELKENMRQLLPLKLYFDNDYPDPATKNRTTKSDYEALYKAYITRLEKYIEGFAGSRSGESDAARDSVERFFINELKFNHDRLDHFSTLLQQALDSGNNAVVTVKGYASPLAETQYNLILSSRRISSLRNYWMKWQNGMLSNYIEERRLKILEEPAGERSNIGVSDNRMDKANSVYNPSAARERKIEVTDIRLVKP